MLTPEEISYYAELSLLVELAAAPKPGLVDRFHRGAHKDMDIFTMLASAAALRPWFRRFAARGSELRGLTEPELFARLRPEGVRAEEEMRAVTGGVNTHRGAIFSLGLICAAAGRLSDTPFDADALCACTARMTAGLSGEAGEEASHGAQARRRYGAAGARGEAEGGFPTVRRAALPVLRRLCADGTVSGNDMALHVLLHLIAAVEDTNILYRRGDETARFVRGRAASILADTEPFTARWREELYRLDTDLTERYVSPGGAADLLAAALLLAFLEEPSRARLFTRASRPKAIAFPQSGTT